MDISEITSKRELEQTDFFFSRKKDVIIPPTLKLIALIILMLLLVFGAFIYNLLLKQDAAIIGFLGSVVGGIISGGMTLFGVLLAFRLEKSHSRKSSFRNIENSFSTFTLKAGNLYELSLKINELIFVSKSEDINETKHKEILNTIKLLNIQESINEFQSKRETLNIVQYQLASMLYVFFNEFQRYWDGVKNNIEGVNKDQKKLDALILNNAKEKVNVALAARTVCWVIAYVNYSDDI